ncbi:MAG: threonine--tRNA ligase [Bdellovibrionales bacterium]
MIKIHLPDQSIKEFEQEPTVLEVAASIGSKLAKDTVGARINSEKEIIDLRSKLSDGTSIEIVTAKSEDGREVIRHSAAHVLAQAAQDLYPGTQVTIGPVTADGFYYDFFREEPFTPDDLKALEKKMSHIIKQNIALDKKVISRNEAIQTFENLGEKFKVELIKDLPESEEISIYEQGGQKDDGWFDLCRGPHIQKTGQIKAFKLLSIAGSYWRGDEKRESLQRVYGTAFESKEALAEHMHLLEEAKKRDHRVVGKNLDLFTMVPEYAPGSPFFTPKGTHVYNALQNYMREKYEKFGYEEVITPQIFDTELYHKSGHYENYKENMFFTETDGREFSVKPMNCPGHCLLYNTKKKSYRELPWRVADFGRLHRYERSGVMHGLTRVRTFCQDDAHVFCRMDQLQDEIAQVMTFLNEVYNELGMPEYKIFLSTRPEKRMGSDEIWDKAEGALSEALKSLDLDYEVNEGDGAFYGPKLDIMFVDALKREWQLGTMQCDFNLPEAFDLSFVNEDNTAEKPVMLHRAILGSMERFFGVYLEHTGGRLPFWMVPTQIKVLNVSDKHSEFCEELTAKFKENGLRAEFDSRGEKLGFKIREAQLEQVPYMITCGDDEVSSGNISVRLRTGEVKKGLKVDDFIKELVERLKNRSLDL